MQNDSSMYDETTTTDKDSPSLVDLPPELLFHIIRMLPQSPYYKCLSVCKRLDEVENEYTVEHNVMCMCRLHEDSPNLPSRELKLFICWNVSSWHFITFIELIKRRFPTCNTKIHAIGKELDDLKNHLEEHHDHPYVKAFMENCEIIIDHHCQYKLSKTIDLSVNESNDLKKEFITNNLDVYLVESHEFIKRFCNILKGSCFRMVIIHCNNVSFLLFNDYLKNYWHISDILDFQTKVRYLYVDQVISMSFPSNLLSDFYNLTHVFLTMNEDDLENLKSRLSELTQAFKEANLRNLNTFSLSENSSFQYVNDLIPLWTDLLHAIPSKCLETLEIGSITVENSDENHILTQSESNDLSLAHGIARFAPVEFLTIHHMCFDSTLLRILPSLSRLRNLDLRISMDMSNKNVIDELCDNLEKCQSLREIRLYVSIEVSMMFSNIFVSLAKIKRSIGIILNLGVFNELPADEWFEKLRVMRNLQEIYATIDGRKINEADGFYTAADELRQKFKKFISARCQVQVTYRD